MDNEVFYELRKMNLIPGDRIIVRLQRRSGYISNHYAIFRSIEEDLVSTSTIWLDVEMENKIKWNPSEQSFMITRDGGLTPGPGFPLIIDVRKVADGKRDKAPATSIVE